MASGLQISVLLITGPVGVGKTTAAHAVARRLRAAGLPHAMIDLDAIAECYPAPADDPFNFRLTMRNLAALWQNDADAGARYLVLNWVVEDRAELEAYHRAIPGAEIAIVRLSAPIETIHRRVWKRGGDSDVSWDLARSRQLAEEMDQTRLEDVLVETEGKTPDEIAREILAHLGWIPSP